MALSSKDLALPRYQVGDVIAGKYRLDGLLGEGGMGAVWGAFNLQLEAPVAIKVLLRSERDHDLLTQRLKQEARVAAKLGHPAIVRIFDVGESERGDPFIVMELLKGRSLATWLAEDGRLAVSSAVQLLLPIADALAVAHAKGIIHRDLKPDNVFISDDDQLQPKLVDFGIVKVAGPTGEDSHLTQMGTVLGSPEYMSPEQARGRNDVDHRTDIWSFCVLLYEVVSGSTPFAAENYNALLRSIVEDDPRAFVARSPEEADLFRILLCGLVKNREERFQSMAELGRALAGWLIRQGVLEDACGASLETKWISRPSDGSTLRSARPPLPTPAPESGVRRSSDELAVAPTLDVQHEARVAVPSGAAPALPEPPATSRAPRLAAAAAFALALVAALVALWQRGGATTLTLAAEPRAHASLPEPAARAEQPPLPAPSAKVEVEPAPIEQVSPPAQVPNERRAPSKTARPLDRARPLGSSSTTSSKPEDQASSDLLSPY
jgi:serine/threonine-protein kinase